MKRRTFIAALGGAAAWPLVARGDSTAKRVVGYISVGTPEAAEPFMVAMREGLKETGFTEGQNLTIEYRWARGDFSKLPILANELVRLPVDLIVTAVGGGTPSIAKAIAATSTIPIVFLAGSDPVRSGLVSSLNRPDGNRTGVSMFANELGSKRLELLRELVPQAKVIAILENPTNAYTEIDLRDVHAAARKTGQQIRVLSASSEHDFAPAFATMVRERDDALMVMADPFFNTRRKQLVSLAAQSAIPAIYEWREFVVAGGLMSYGSRLTDATRQLGIYAGKILQGVNPADLPVVQAVKVELALNLKVAKTLGITFPLSLLARADEVIE